MLGYLNDIISNHRPTRVAQLVWVGDKRLFTLETHIFTTAIHTNCLSIIDIVILDIVILAMVLLQRMLRAFECRRHNGGNNNNYEQILHFLLFLNKKDYVFILFF